MLPSLGEVYRTQARYEMDTRHFVRTSLRGSGSYAVCQSMIHANHNYSVEGGFRYVMASGAR